MNDNNNIKYNKKYNIIKILFEKKDGNDRHMN